MKVLIATGATQGEVDGDYAWTLDGELVTPVVAECRSAATCGCARGFPGLASEKATTTAMVVDHPHFTREGVQHAIEDSLQRQGWLTGLGRDDITDVVGEHVESIELIGRSFPVGAVLRRNGTHVYTRDDADD